MPSENFDRLGEATGLQLELEDTKGSVGTFSANILARGVRPGGMFIVENHLDESDNPHLGRCQTSLSPLDPKVMILVVTSCHGSHRSAADSLNRNTTPTNSP